MKKLAAAQERIRSQEMKKMVLAESPAERRGRLASDEPGEMVFTSQFAYVEAMQARVRRATATVGGDTKVKQKAIAEDGEMSPSTVGNMVSGKTHWPRFSTMFGIAAALGVEVVMRPAPKGRKQ